MIKGCEPARYSNLTWSWYGLGTELVLFLSFFEKVGGKGFKDFKELKDLKDLGDRGDKKNKKNLPPNKTSNGELFTTLNYSIKSTPHTPNQ